VRAWLWAAGLALAACAAPAAVPPLASPPPDFPLIVTDYDTESANVGSRPTSHPLIGKPLPAFRLAREDGESFSDVALKGRWTVIAFTGAWCGDSRADAPHLAALGSAIDQDPGLDIVAVHVDARYGTYLSAGDFFDQSGIRMPVALDADRDVYRALEVTWVPSYLVVDPQGVVRGFRTDLSAETSNEGGVKRFIKDIAILRGATSDQPV
jgi:peroxiredoxin